jgi:hypothetical protein
LVTGRREALNATSSRNLPLSWGRVRFKQSLRRLAADDLVRHGICVLLMRIASLAYSALELHAASLLNHVRSLVRGCVKARRSGERNVIAGGEGLGAHCNCAFGGGAVGVSLNVRHVMFAERSLDGLQMRQRPSRSAGTVYGGRLHLFSRLLGEPGSASLCGPALDNFLRASRAEPVKEELQMAFSVR